MGVPFFLKHPPFCGWKITGCNVPFNYTTKILWSHYTYWVGHHEPIFQLFPISKHNKWERIRDKNRSYVHRVLLKKACLAGFEPARAKPTRFRVMPVNHSGTSTQLSFMFVIVNLYLSFSALMSVSNSSSSLWWVIPTRWLRVALGRVTQHVHWYHCKICPKTFSTNL